MNRSGLLLMIAAAVGLSCRATAPEETSDAGIPKDAGQGGADAGTPADAGASCTSIPVPLIVESESGVPNRVFANVTWADQPAAFLFDTGSNATFLSLDAGAPDPVWDAGEVQVGACLEQIMGRPYGDDETLPGLPILGTLGADALLAMPSELNLDAGLLVRYGAAGLPKEMATWPHLPMDVVTDVMIVHVTLDGQAVRLIVDTGSPDALWVGQQPQPGDTTVQTTDALGDPLTLYLGTATLDLGNGVTRVVPVLRAPSFPYFEQSVQALGGNIQGLFGLSALGIRTGVDPVASELMISPP